MSDNPSKLVMTEQRLAVTELYAASTETKLTAAEIALATGLRPNSINATIKALVGQGWFGAEWEEVDASDFTAAPSRLFFPLPERRDALLRKLDEYKVCMGAARDRLEKRVRVGLPHHDVPVVLPAPVGDDDPLEPHPADKLRGVDRGVKWVLVERLSLAAAGTGLTRVTRAQAELLRHFVATPGLRMSLSKLAEALGKAVQNVHRTLKLLERAGWMTSSYEQNESYPTRMVAMTADGVKVAREVVPLFWPKGEGEA